jgi:hypothetical protein
MAHTEQRPPQFSLRHLFAWVALASFSCGSASAWLAYLRIIESRNGGFLPLETIHVTVFFALLFVGIIFGLTVVVPLLLVILYWKSRKRRKAVNG